MRTSGSLISPAAPLARDMASIQRLKVNTFSNKIRIHLQAACEDSTPRVRRNVVNLLHRRLNTYLFKVKEEYQKTNSLPRV